MENNNTIDFVMEEFSEEFIREWNRKRYCKRCGSPLRDGALGEYRCMNCGRSELNDYGKVRKYLDENGSASARMIEAATGVPVIVINELLEKGKIQIVSNDVSYLKCRVCGAPLKFGKLCPACAAKRSDGLKDVYSRGYIGEGIPEKKVVKETSASESTERARPRMHTWVKKRDGR